MGQAVRKFTSVWKTPSSSAAAGGLLKHKPAESRFQDPRLRGHLPGDVHPFPPPFRSSPMKPDEDSMEWDRESPMYKEMIRKMSATVVTRGPLPVTQGAHTKRPLPTNRTRTSGPDENVIVAPGTLNVGHIRELFLSYQRSSEADGKPPDAKTLAEKHNVDVALLEKVLHYYYIPENRIPHGKEDNSMKPQQK